MKLTDNRWLTGRGFGVHSPWAYDLIENVINERHPYYAYEDLYPYWEKAPQYLPQYPQSSVWSTGSIPSSYLKWVRARA